MLSRAAAKSGSIRGILVCGLRYEPSVSKFRPIILSRPLSTRNVFGGASMSEQPAAAGIAPTFDIPEVPTPVHTKTIEEMYQNGESLIGELELFQWWKPSGYFRYALEYLHLYTGLEWWATIACATLALRLLTVWVPIMTQKMQAQIGKNQPELDKFKERLNDARRENDKLMTYRIMIEQRDFMRANDIRMGRQFIALAMNMSVFVTQFFAIKKMVKAGYPGLSEGGTLWFKDLTVPDPYFILPMISAATLYAVMRTGIETGQKTDSMTPSVQLVLQYGVPLAVLIGSTQFSSALCIYWVTSNIISLIYSNVFRIPQVRKAFNIPQAPARAVVKKKENPFKAFMRQYRENKNTPRSYKDIREKDALQFKNAGKGKPYRNVFTNEKDTPSSS